MAKWIQSAWYRVVYGYEYDKERSDKSNVFLDPDYECLSGSLQEFNAWLRRGQWKICGVTPLTSSHAYMNWDTSTSEHRSWGYGYAYGLTPIIGFVAFVQKELDITDEEYRERIDALSKKNRLETLKKQLADMQAAVEEDQKLTLAIEEKKGLLGGCKYIVDGTTYKTREEAAEALAALQKGCADRAGALERLSSEYQQITTDVAALEEKYGDINEAW